MARARTVLGLVAAGMLILSSFAHSILGWKGLSEELAKTNAPANLVTGLKVGWMYGGVVMLVLGVILIPLFTRRLRGEEVSGLPAAAVSVAYLGFGAWALLASDLSPFFMGFMVQGVLLAVAAPR